MVVLVAITIAEGYFAGFAVMSGIVANSSPFANSAS
jgi:hypothetical protein